MRRVIAVAVLALLLETGPFLIAGMPGGFAEAGVSHKSDRRCAAHQPMDRRHTRSSAVSPLRRKYACIDGGSAH